MKITLMSWGNAIVRSRGLSGSGQVLSMTMELNLQGDFRLTKKKVTWLAAPSSDYRPLADITFLDYDYLITKKKVEEGDSLADLVTPVTEFREEGVADANILELTPGDIIQFERKGYYIYDGKGGRGQGKMEFIRIPDGKAASLASKAGV